MNKFELIKQMDTDQVAHFICYQHQECDFCPVRRLCSNGVNGWGVFLRRHATNTDRIAAGMPTEYTVEEMAELTSGSLVIREEEK